VHDHPIISTLVMQIPHLPTKDRLEDQLERPTLRRQTEFLISRCIAKAGYSAVHSLFDLSNDTTNKRNRESGSTEWDSDRLNLRPPIESNNK
jgi:hypothetical protein